MIGKTILLIGSSGGIGSQLAKMFPDDTVILHYHRNKPSLDGYRLSADITKYDEVERMIADVLEDFDRIDVLINASGISINGFLHKLSPQDWNSVLDVNLLGSFNLARALLPHMRSNQYGRIITMASVVFQHPVMGTSAYSTSKAALVGLTRTLALENANMGITCNCISLGYFDAGMLYKIPIKLREEICQKIPMKRFGGVHELQRTIQFLIDTEYMTGQVLSLNGGLHMS